jgi:biopolymer transport protein ExbD
MDRVTLNMASMIDATFLLLAYFLVTTALRQPEDRLSPTLQTRSESGPPSDLQPQVVEVRAIEGEPGYQLGDRTFRDRDSLAEALGSLPREAGVFVRVGDDVATGFAVAAVQAARDAGFQQVTYVPAKP